MANESLERETAVAALKAAIQELVDFEGSALESALIEECLLPDLRAVLRAIERQHSAAGLVDQAAATCRGLQRADKAFRSSGFAAVGSVLSNASYRLQVLREISACSD